MKTVRPVQGGLIIKPWQAIDTASIDDIHELGCFQSYQLPSHPVDAATNKFQNVLIEWMLYSPAWDTQSEDEKVLKITALAELLHCPKPTGFRVLDCMGVIPPTVEVAHEGFGFVYALPTHDQKVSTGSMIPRTLLQIMQTKNSTRFLEDKFRIARCLTTSIYELHSASWLHKNISSSSLMFFFKDEPAANGSSGLKEDPYLVGFHHSRPDGEIWFSDADLHSRTPYRHPHYIFGTTRFEKVQDYYSVGIVLFEIGFWESISEFQARHKGNSEQAFREVLIRKCWINC